MLDYPSLVALGAVIHEGSFERAAKVLGMTPSAVSQRVRGLEERLGAILIIRGQPCGPTDLGRRLCAHLDRVQLLEDDLAPMLGGNSVAAKSLTLKIAVNADSLATWFPRAIAAFGRGSAISLDVTLDDETHTADRLRSGEVLAAVTADPEPVQGCKTMSLGTLRYAACASPDFIGRHFGSGMDKATLAMAPHLRFDRRDMLQARWALATYGIDLSAPTHWIPSTQGFVDLALAGLGWGMQPLMLAETHIAAGRLIELPPEQRVDVRLYWTFTRLYAQSLSCLTKAVCAAAERSLVGSLAHE
jgi:LysR family transcriptional regulator, chromosome initiation inhibitor